MNLFRSLYIMLLAALVPFGASAQSPSLGITNTQFHPQGWAIGSNAAYTVVICNPSDHSLGVNSGQVYNAARAWGISLVGYERVERVEKELEAPSRWRWIGWAAQWCGFSFTAADQFGAWKIGDEENPARWKALIPLVGVALKAVIEWLDKNAPESEVPPADLRLPLFFQVPGQSGGIPGCVQYPVFGVNLPASPSVSALPEGG